jgi:hypothetical protein
MALSGARDAEITKPCKFFQTRYDVVFFWFSSFWRGLVFVLSNSAFLSALQWLPERVELQLLSHIQGLCFSH